MDSPICVHCGAVPAALPLATCVDCWAAVRDTPEHELVDTLTIAARAGVEADTVRKWATRHVSFPRPVLTLANGQIWRWSAVRAWLELSGRLTPR